MIRSETRAGTRVGISPGGGTEISPEVVGMCLQDASAAQSLAEIPANGQTPTPHQPTVTVAGICNPQGPMGEMCTCRAPQEGRVNGGRWDPQGRDQTWPFQPLRASPTASSVGVSFREGMKCSGAGAEGAAWGPLAGVGGGD